MKRFLLSTMLLAISFGAVAQDEEETPKEGWTRGGTASLLFSQSAFNQEWSTINGGTGNFTGDAAIGYDFNYYKEGLTWDNRVTLNYGITKINGDDFSRKTNDRLEFNSIAGKQRGETNWYYSWFLNFRTQISKGYDFSEGTSGETIRTETTHFLSPGYLQTGPGMLWKKSDNLKVNIAPATARLIFVDDKFTQFGDGYFGVDQGESTRFEFGAALSGYAKFDLMENISMENILNLYSNYLEDPQNVDVDYTMNLNMKVNEYINTMLTFQAIYDDNAALGFQIREVIGVGVGYTF